MFCFEAVCRKNRVDKTGGIHQREAFKVKRKKEHDLRCALADCDHALRFYDQNQIEASSQCWIVWQLRGRIRAAMGVEDFQCDFANAQKLDPSCAMTYLLCGRCLWRQQKWDEAKAKYQEGLAHPHNKNIKHHMQNEYEELVKQMKEWHAWEAEEAERCACVVS